MDPADKYQNNLLSEKQCNKSTFKKKYAIKKMLDLVDVVLDMALVLFVADFIVRIFRAFLEFFHYKYYYEADEKLIRIVKRSFFYENLAVFYMFVLLCCLLVRFIRTKQFISSGKHFGFMFVYWIWICCNVSSSKLDYAYWLRGDHNLDYAKGMASNFFFGYLFLTLPSNGGVSGIKDRMQSYENRENVTFVLDRLVILVSVELYSKGTFESSILEKAKAMEQIELKRGGIRRPFKNDVYRFKEKMGPYNMTYYISVEAATPLVSYYESLNNNGDATWQMKETTREVVIEFYRYLKKLCFNRPDIRNDVEIIFYDPRKTDGTSHDVGEFLKSYLEDIHRTRKLKWRKND